MKNKPIWKESVPISKMIAMKEAERPYYDPNAFWKLKHNISEGFKTDNAVSGIWNEAFGKYEIFKGTHRLRASKELGLRTLPMWDYTKVYDRSQAIAEGYMDNDLNAPMNPMARCHAFKALSVMVLKKYKKEGAGRNPTMGAQLVAKMVHTSEDTVANHLKFGEFTKPVQDLIGHGKLRVKQAIKISRLIGKVEDRVIEELAKQASKGFWIPSRVQYEVEQILSKKDVTHRVCYACKQRKSVDEFVRMYWNGKSLDVCRECYAKLNNLVAVLFHNLQTRAERLYELRARFQLNQGLKE